MPKATPTSPRGVMVPRRRERRYAGEHEIRRPPTVVVSQARTPGHGVVPPAGAVIPYQAPRSLTDVVPRVIVRDQSSGSYHGRPSREHARTEMRGHDVRGLRQDSAVSGTADSSSARQVASPIEPEPSKPEDLIEAAILGQLKKVHRERLTASTRCRACPGLRIYIYLQSYFVYKDLISNRVIVGINLDSRMEVPTFRSQYPGWGQEAFADFKEEAIDYLAEIIERHRAIGKERVLFVDRKVKHSRIRFSEENNDGAFLVRPLGYEEEIPWQYLFSLPIQRGSGA